MVLSKQSKLCLGFNNSAAAHVRLSTSFRFEEYTAGVHMINLERGSSSLTSHGDLYLTKLFYRNCLNETVILQAFIDLKVILQQNFLCCPFKKKKVKVHYSTELCSFFEL